MKVVELPSQQTLLGLLACDPATGVFTWKVPRGKGKIQPGASAGYVLQGPTNGYRLIGLTVNGTRRLFRAHRLAWKMMTGQEPPERLDHINRDRQDNRWSNLRDGTGTVNHGNRAALRRTTATGAGLPTGVHRHGRGYMARRRNKYLGTFGSVEEAHQACLSASA